MKVVDKNKCRVCKQPVKITIYRNTGICSENCRKIDNGEKP